MRVPRPVGIGIMIISLIGVLAVHDVVPRSCSTKPFYALPWSSQPSPAYVR